jgi:hypothetical protein
VMYKPGAGELGCIIIESYSLTKQGESGYER